ncbi:MAG: hypothetical protein WC802_01095 [Patescibacteria group bacterium]|jgi:hypothetical protein
MDSSAGAKQAFTVKEVLDKGWEVTQKYWVSYVLAIIGIAVVSGLLSAVGGAIHSSIFQFVFFLLNLAWEGIAVIAIVRLSLNAVDGKEVSLQAIFTSSWLEVAYMVAILILLAIVVGIGSVLFVVPGIIAALMFGYAPFVAVEKKLSPIDAMKASMALTEGNRMNMFWYLLAVVGLGMALGVAMMILATVAMFVTKIVAILGTILFLLLGIASIVAYCAFVMVYVFGFAYIYRKLTAMRPEALKV